MQAGLTRLFGLGAVFKLRRDRSTGYPPGGLSKLSSTPARAITEIDRAAGPVDVSGRARTGADSLGLIRQAS
jgi:hypothetical protein